MGLCRPSFGPRGCWIGDCYANRLRSAVPVPFRWQVVMPGSAQRLWLHFCKRAELFLPSSCFLCPLPPTYPVRLALPVLPPAKRLGGLATPRNVQPSSSYTAKRNWIPQPLTYLQTGCYWGTQRQEGEGSQLLLVAHSHFQALSLIIPDSPHPAPTSSGNHTGWWLCHLLTMPS